MANPVRNTMITILVVCIFTSTIIEVASGISCGQVLSSVSGCINYARNGGVMPPGCCAGVKALNSAARTTGDRQQACSCLKTIIRSIPGIKEDIVSGIPGKCGVNVGYPIRLSTDCSKVH